MKYVDDFRCQGDVIRLADAICATVTRPWTIMEVCGGQTHAIMRFGLDRLLPPDVELLHGPGCPVCVTPEVVLEQALTLARTPNLILCTFADMLPVPSAGGSLAEAKAAGADVRVVYSPLETLAIAEANPQREVVLFAIGFETTAPANALTLHRAKAQGLVNFSSLVAQVLVPPALEALLDTPEHRIDAFLAAGHVCAVMGLDEYRPIAQRYRVPVVATGFEPVDILQGVLSAIQQLEAGEAHVDNVYARAVAPKGNTVAQALLREVFEPVARDWRGMGCIAQSGLGLRPAYRAFDAVHRFDLPSAHTAAPSPCIAGEVLQGLARPDLCPAFGRDCTPEHPLGVTMVSSEGACAAYYRYRAQDEPTA